MPTITQLEYIVAVDEQRGFSRAAQECNVSQPSLSAQVQKIEDELGVAIFDRSKKPIQTTPIGSKIIKKAKVVLSECRQLVDLSADEEEASGYFHLGIIPSVAPYLLPLFIENFAKKYPKVVIKISEFKTEDILKAIYDEKIDAGLLVTPLYDEKIEERVLYYEKFNLFVADDHNLAQKKVIKDSDLDPDSIWLLEEGHCFRDQVIKVCALKKRPNVLDNVSFSSGSMETLLNLIRNGNGYTLIPELAAKNLPEKEKN